MNWLMFELAGPLASFGGVAPGSIRDTELAPSRSALLGLLAAALGIDRDEVQRQRQLDKDLSIAARVNTDAQLQRDYHTAQAPTQAALKGRPCTSRRDELSVPKDDLNTVLSDRYYYANFAATIGIASQDTALLDTLAQALRAPHYTLYIGRKSCPPAWPLDPHRVVADTWTQALAMHDARAESKLNAFDADMRHWLRNRRSRYLHCVDLGIDLGELDNCKRHITRHDEPTDTSRRLFADRSHWRAEEGKNP